MRVFFYRQTLGVWQCRPLRHTLHRALEYDRKELQKKSFKKSDYQALGLGSDRGIGFLTRHRLGAHRHRHPAASQPTCRPATAERCAMSGRCSEGGLVVNK